MSFNTTQNVSGVIDLLQYNNAVTNGLFGYMVLATIWFISFSLSSVYRTDHAITAAFFVTFILSSLFVIMGFVGIDAVLLSLAGMLVGYFLAKV